MYLVQIDHNVYEPRGGGSFTLPDAMREVYGTRHARILRAADMSVAVHDAGNATQVVHRSQRPEMTFTPERTVTRRPARRRGTQRRQLVSTLGYRAPR